MIKIFINRPFLNLILINLLTRYRKKLVKLLSVISKHLLLKPKKYIFYISALTGILMFIINGLITRGHSFYNFFNPDKTNFYMDFFNSIHTLYNGPYTHQSIYPPLPLLVYRFLLRMVPYDIVEQGAEAIRATQAGQVVLLLYMIITIFLFFVLLMEIKKGSKIEKYIFSFVILFSAPFIFQFERGNIIFVALLFLMVFVFFKDSAIRIVREFALVCLAISAAIKFYPAIFGLLLIKEKRFKDVIRVVIYGIAVFVLPFFATGGINQLPVLLKNIFSTSSDSTTWGLGYAVNIQTTIRIIFGFFGNFDYTPIFIGSIFSLMLLFLGIIAMFYSRSKWKTTALLALLMIMVPSISYEYALIFMLIPLIMFLDREEKEEKLDYVYLVCFILIFIPLTFGRIDVINNGYGNPSLPLTYGLLIQNLAIFSMIIFLTIQGLSVEIPKIILTILRNYLFFFMKKIYGTKSKGIKAYVFITGKIYVTVFIILIIFGYDLFYVIHTYYKTKNYISPLSKEGVEGIDIPQIYNVEPGYIHYGNKVIVEGTNFNWWLNKHAKFMSTYGAIEPEYWDNIFTVPLHWKIGYVSLWVERPVIGRNDLLPMSNKVKIKIIDRMGKFNDDDIKYFAQIKYLDKDTRKINNFKLYKFRKDKYRRWIPNKTYQLYADFKEFINSF